MFHIKSNKQRKLLKDLKVVSVVGSVFFMAYAGTTTYQSVHGENQYTASEFIPEGSKRLFQISTHKANQAVNQNHNMVQHQNQQHNNFIHQGLKATPYEQKRLSMVAKYINTNNKSHNIKHAYYNKAQNRLVIVFNNKKPNVQQQKYAQHLIKEFNANN